VPLSGLLWNGPRGFDFHLLRNGPLSPDLTGHLVVFWSDGRRFLANQIPADIQTLTIQFRPRFVGAPNNFGVLIDVGNGSMQALAAPPGVQLRNFIMDAVARDTGPGGGEFHQKIRIHVHNAIHNAPQSIWLAPNILTVHQNAAHVRFTVMARFDDGVIGDISDLDILRWTALTPASVNVNNRSGELTVNVPNGDFVVELRRAGAAANSPPDATGTVRCAPPWATPTPVNFVAGKGADHREEVPNILFLSDGFDGGSGAFDVLVRSIVRQLGTSSSTRPFDLLSNEMNYWSAFVPSRQPGMSVAPELLVVPQPGGLRGVEVQLPIDPALRAPAPGQPWTLAEMVHEVGLPVPVDDPPNRPLEGQGGKLEDWQALYGPQITNDRVVFYNQPEPDSGLELFWLNYSQRTLLNDLDTSFYMTIGQRPRVEISRVFRSPAFNPLRIATGGANGMADDFTAFLRNLQFQGNTIGARWATNGKDFDRVCILARSNHLGGVNERTKGYIVCTLNNDRLHVVSAAQVGPGFEPQPKAVPTNPSIELTTTVAHETAHSFNLDDEYGELQRTQRVLNIPASQVAGLAQEANTIGDSDLRELGAGPIVPGRIKWNWPRIKKAGILADKPGFLGSGTYQLKMQPGHTSLFRKDDFVKLRGRNLLPSATPGAPAAMPLTSYVLQVQGIDPGDLMTVFGIAGDPDPTAYPAGSLLLCPVRDSSGNDLNLIAPIVFNYLGQAQEPLNRNKASPAPACTFDLDPRQTARNLPDGLPRCRPRKKNMIVGLWDGGSTFHCGVYHPTGFCMMRSRIVDSQISGFCTVCRYFLVDLLDPTKHGKLDDEYAEYYPQP
jgi:hypothetical protein